MKKALVNKSTKSLLQIVFLCIVWFAIGWIVHDRWPRAEIDLISQAQKHLLSHYPGKAISDRELSYAAIRGMLQDIDDPHAALLVPPISQRFQYDFAGESGVIGLFPEKRGEHMVVTVVFPGEPAAQAGLRVGDIILSVDDMFFDADITPAETILLIRGPVGQAAHFVIQRDDEILDFYPVRKERSIVSYQLLPENIAYIAQYTFTTNATAKMKQALEAVLVYNPDALIWDLRSNGGGSMQVARSILNYFIEDGLLFVAELKGGQQKKFIATNATIAPDIPIIVLVGEHTYSAAETATATMLERNRGIIIGDITYGKGTIQTTEPIGKDCLLQITIAKWLSPNGIWYEGQGITPEIQVYDDEQTPEDEVLEFAVDYALQKLSP